MTLKDREIMEVYKMYVGIKLHFTNPKYFYTENTVAKLSTDSLLKRKDAKFFAKLAIDWKNKQSELKSFMITIFKNKPDTWIGQFDEMEFKILHEKRMKNIYSFDYVISSDLEKFEDFCMMKKINAKQALKVVDNDRPYAIQCGLRFTDEFLALLNNANNFTDDVSVNPLWNKRAHLIKKYGSVLEITNHRTVEKVNNLFRNEAVET